jgi:hypothetical protein
MMEAIDTPHLLYLLLSLRPVVAVVVGISEVDISVGRDPAVDAVIGLVGEVDAAVFGDSRFRSSLNLRPAQQWSIAVRSTLL